MTEKKTKELAHNALRILAALSDGPMTCVQIAASLKLTRGPVTKFLRQLKRTGLVYKAGELAQPGTRAAPLYSVHTRHEKPKSSANCGKHVWRLESILQAIDDCGPMTTNDLAAWLDVDKTRVRSCITHHRQGGKTASVLRISGWSFAESGKNRRDWLPVWGRGPGSDAKRPVTDKQAYSAEWRANNKARMSASHAKHRMSCIGANVAELSNPFAQIVRFAGVAPRPLGHGKVKEAA